MFFFFNWLLRTFFYFIASGLEDFSSLNYQSTVDTASVELRNEEYCVSSPDVGSAADESTHDSKQELVGVHGLGLFSSLPYCPPSVPCKARVYIGYFDA